MILDPFGEEITETAISLSASPLENPRVPITDPRAYDYLVSNPSSSGVAINRTSILGYPAVWRALNLLGDYVGKLDTYTYKYQKAGGYEKDWWHPAYYLLLRNPSEEYPAFIFKKTMQIQAMWAGNAYAYIWRDQFANPVELTILDPEWTTALRENGRLWYVTSVDMGNGQREERKLNPSDIIHIKGLSPDGLTGYRLIDIMREALGLGLAAQKYGSIYFRNAAQPKYVIQMPGHLDNQEAVERFRAGWGRMHAGLDNQHKPALLEDGATVQAFGINNEEAQFLQTREFEIATTVANIFGIPPHKLGAKISTSYGSLEAENKSLLSDSIDPWLIQWEQELESKLLTEVQKKRDTHFIQFDRSQMTQPDAKTVEEINVIRLNNGLITQAQYNELNNLPNKGEEWEQWHRVPSNLIYIEQAIKEKEEAAKRAEEAAKLPPAPPVAPVGEGEQQAEQPVEAPDSPTDEQQPQAQASETSKAEAALEGLVRYTLERMAKRVLTAAEQQATKKTFSQWVKDYQKDHRQVFIDNLKPAFGEDTDRLADEFFTKLSLEFSTIENSTGLAKRLHSLKAKPASILGDLAL